MDKKTVCQLNEDGYFVGLTSAYKSPLEPDKWNIPRLAIDANPPDIPAGYLAKWTGSHWAYEEILVEEPEDPPIVDLTPEEKRELMFQRRASIKDQLLAWMAADNEGRIQDGIWTHSDYLTMLADPHMSAAMAFMQVMAFERAAEMVQATEHELMTEDIKNRWISKLAEHYYND